jgi:putative ABC transport system permease protein
VHLGGGDGSDDWTGEYVPGPALPSVENLPVTAGSLAALTGTGTVAVPAGTGRPGQVITVWLADSAPVKLRVVAVLANQIDLEDKVLLPWALRAAHTGTPLASAVYLRLAPGSAAVPPGALAAVAAGGGTVTPTASYQSAAGAEQDRMNRLALVAVLGMALSYTGIAIANTLVMATAARRREFATLRLSGASRGQVLRMIGLEAGLVTGLATVLAAAVVAASALGLRAGLASVAPAVHVVVPWSLLGPIAAGCLLTALAASLAPAALALRRRPVELARALD